jgi:outer membrane immunogenic protein
MKFKFVLVILSILGLGAMSNTAMSADMAPPPSQYNWDGVYLGALATYGMAHSHHCDTAACPDNPISGSGPNVNGSGFGGGVEIGFNQTFNNVLFGVEGDYSFTGFNGSSPSQLIPGYGCGAGCITNVTSLGTARLRVGLPMDNILPYLTGGLAFSNVHGQLINGADTSFLNLALGAGLEVGVTPNISIKGEYLHIFDNGQKFLFDAANCAAPGCSLNHYSDDLFRVGLNFRF